MFQSRELLNKVVDLINEAKLESLTQKLYLLDQVKEICLNRDTSLLPEVIPMVADFQADFSVKPRNFVVSFMREVARAHPEHADLLVPVACSLMNDDNTNIKKMAVLLANTAYRPALQRLVDDGSMESARQEWSALEALRHKVLSAITDPAGLAEIAMVAFKFAETVVLACVGGRGLGPGSSREDRSVHRDLSPTHPFLLADTLDQAGHALARQMVGWLGTGSAGGGGAGSAAAKGTAWGSRFGAQHYAALINALQSLATNRAALFPDIVPGMASALESVNGGGTANANPAHGGGGKKNANAAAAAPTAAASSGTEGGVPEGLRDAASSLRSACLKLLKVAPGASKGVQRLAAAAALAGSDGEAKAAVDGNQALRGRVKLPNRPKERITRTSRQRARPVRILAGTGEERRALADLAASACRGKVPKPPPGYKHKRTPGFPLADLELLFGHVLNALGPDLATVKGEATPPQHADGKASAGSKRARSSGTIEGSGKKKRRSGEQQQPVFDAVKSDGPRETSENGRSQEDGLEGELRPGQASEAEREEEESLEGATYLTEAKRAFSRVLSVWEGAVLEGKRGLHQRIVARLGRILAESEATVMVAKRCEETPDGGKSQTVVETAVDFTTEDYRKRYDAALTLLTDIYAADVAATFSDKNSGRSDVKASSTSIAPLEYATAGETSESISTSIRKAPGGDKPRRGKGARGRRRGFEVYDKTLLTLLSGLSGSLESAGLQKLFTQTLLESPRVPVAALKVVCGLCEAVSRPHDVQTGLVTLKDLIFHKPATRSVCVPSVLHFTHHSDNGVRTKAVRLAANLLWPDPAFQATVEAFAKQALASVRSPGLNEEIKKEMKEEKVEIEGEKKTSSAATTPQEQDVVDFEGGDGDEEVETPPPAPPPGQRMVVAGPWQAPPETETAARTRLSLYFALCVKSRQMLAGLLEAYVTVSPAAQAGLMTELPLLARAAAKGFGEPGVVGLMGDAPPGAKTLVLAMLDLLVPKEINKPSPELVAAVRRLREARVAAVVHEEERSNGVTGVEYMVPVLGGLGREGVASELPALFQADDAVVGAGFWRLTHPAKGATYTPAELVVLLNNFDHAAAGVPLKRLTSVLSLCLDNKVEYNYAVLREALTVMSQVPPAGAGAKQLPLLLMRTVMVSVTKFADLKNFVATVVLVRLVQNEVWTQPRIWDGFLRCSQMMAKDSGATSFIALLQLPAARLKEALASPALKGSKERLRRYAQTLVKVDPGVKAVLGMEVASGESSSKK